MLIGDMDTIVLSAEIKYAALESLSLGITGTSEAWRNPRTHRQEAVGSYRREYLEKLIQIQLRLPPPLPKDLRKMLVPVAGERSAFPPNAGQLKFSRLGGNEGHRVTERIVAIGLDRRAAITAVRLLLHTFGASSWAPCSGLRWSQ